MGLLHLSHGFHSQLIKLAGSFSAFERQHLHEPLRSIHGGTFITADTVNHRQGETGINILHHSVALEALYDSADSFPQPRCHPETRTKMLEDLYNWAIEEESDSAQPICWLHGPAGAGKSAIMQTLCQRLQDARRLGGTFFFKRDHPTRGNPEVLFATLAYQLAEHNRDLRSLISQIVEDNPSLVARHMKVQLYKLIVEPCHLLIDSPPLILLIDGLDECETQDLQVEILRLVGSAVQHHPKTFQFLIASRPEAHIRETFNDPSFNGILDSVNVEKSFEDIRRYFADEFTRIHREHRDTMGSIPTPWPSPKVVDSLVWKSSGYFIYASTVIRFIDDKLSRLTERLAVIQSLTPTDAEAPFAALDQLYIQILSRVPIRFHFTLLDILQCMIVSESMRNPLQIDRLLELPSGETQLILRGLHSVLEIKKTRRLSVHHASFLEFLKDPQRSLHFHIKLENRMSVARAFLKGLSDDSHWHANSCNLSISDFEKCIVSVPPSIELVPLIRRFNPDFIWCQRWEDFHTFYSEIDEILTWLKEHPNPPLDLIERWQNYLAKSEDICTHCDEWDPYEKRWQKRANFSVVDLNKTHVPLDEEEIVRAWEDELETAILDGGYEDVEWIL
ncbi:NACHT domain-containing protein [Mycena venus]|uniref:NACHT domain-containing protein n=1 Tax=Mycena venus TaxID=2733690 RepID=A0A8H7CYN2_9AGAR|nr:NACHT domain-containing protein [Mycena venus]